MTEFIPVPLLVVDIVSYYNFDGFINKIYCHRINLNVFFVNNIYKIYVSQFESNYDTPDKISSRSFKDKDAVVKEINTLVSLIEFKYIRLVITQPDIEGFDNIEEMALI